MIILGLDPGLANTGWGIVEVKNNKFSCIDFGTINTASDLELGQRLAIIYDELEKIILKYKPKYAGVESLFFAKNKLSAIPVAQAKGVLLLLLNQHSIQVEEFTPIQIKQNITGSGKATKSCVQDLTKLLLGSKNTIKSDHAADALAAGICFYNTFNFNLKLKGVINAK